MWTENGDKLSMQYAGTNSNISGVLEEGKQGVRGKLGQLMTGVQRYLVNTYSDPDKQQSINVLMGRHPEQVPYGIRHKLSECLRLRLTEYMDTRPIRVGCLTWNCAGNPPPDNLDVRTIVLPQAYELKSYQGGRTSQQQQLSLFGGDAAGSTAQGPPLKD